MLFSNGFPARTNRAPRLVCLERRAGNPDLTAIDGVGPLHLGVAEVDIAREVLIDASATPGCKGSNPLIAVKLAFQRERPNCVVREVGIDRFRTFYPARA